MIWLLFSACSKGGTMISCGYTFSDESSTLDFLGGRREDGMESLSSSSYSSPEDRPLSLIYIISYYLLSTLRQEEQCIQIGKGSFLLADSLGLLDGLDLLQQECPDDPGFHAAGTQHSPVGPRHGLLPFGEFLIGEGPELGDAVDSLPAVAAVVGGAWAVGSFLHVLHHDFGAGGFDFPYSVGGRVVAESAAVGNSLDHPMVISNELINIQNKYGPLQQPQFKYPQTHSILLYNIVLYFNKYQRAGGCRGGGGSYVGQFDYRCNNKFLSLTQTNLSVPPMMQNSEEQAGYPQSTPALLEDLELQERTLLEITLALSLEETHSRHWRKETGLSSRYARHIQNMKMTKSSQKCSICLSEFCSDQIIKRLPCRHIFHRQCAKNLLKTSKNCPNCRYDLEAHFLTLQKQGKLGTIQSKPEKSVKVKQIAKTTPPVSKSSATEVTS